MVTNPMDEEQKVTTPTHNEQLIEKARNGDADALGQLLSRYSNYLTLLARVQLSRRIQAKVDPADVVQDAFLEAHRHFGQFRGGSEQEFTAWMRQILCARLANVVRHYLGTKGRDIRFERDLAVELDQSSRLLDAGLIAVQSSPSQAAAKRETAVLLADALDQLPEDYREAIILRQLEGLPFNVVAERMQRSEDSVQKLWVRGLARLRKVMEGLQ
jgi:RNA polymerase sigma-70 factor (ECF subfamily)